MSQSKKKQTKSITDLDLSTRESKLKSTCMSLALLKVSFRSNVHQQVRSNARDTVRLPA